MSNVANEDSMTATLRGIGEARGWVLDVDGCLVRTTTPGGTGGTPFPGARDLLRSLRETGRRFVICTNASLRPAAQYASQLRAMGLDVRDEDIVTAATAAAAHVAARHRGQRVLALGGDGLRVALLEREVELSDSDGPLVGAVVVGAADSYSAADINAACLAIADRGAAFYTTVDAPWFHGGIGRAVSASTAIALAITAVTGVQAQVCGKPSSAVAGVLREHLGLSGSEIVVVGDAATAEMRLAHDMGALGVLVLSGATRASDVSSLPDTQRPHLCVQDVGDLLEKIKSHLHIGGKP